MKKNEHHSGRSRGRRARRPVADRGSALSAQNGVAFYKGKTVTYIVATAPGGGYDTYGRLVADVHRALSAGLDVRRAQHAGRGPTSSARTRSIRVQAQTA